MISFENHVIEDYGTIVCFGAFIGPISDVCYAVELTLVVGGICPFVVVDQFRSDNGSSFHSVTPA